MLEAEKLSHLNKNTSTMRFRTREVEKSQFPKGDFSRDLAAVTMDFCGAQRFRCLLFWRGQVISPVAPAHRVRVTAMARIAGDLLVPHGEDSGAGKI